MMVLKMKRTPNREKRQTPVLQKEMKGKCQKNNKKLLIENIKQFSHMQMQLRPSGQITS